MLKSFSERLQYLIDKKKINQTSLVDAKLGTAAQVSKWLSGQIDTPRRKTIQNLAEYFMCDVNWLADGTGEPFPTVFASQSYGDLGRIVSGMHSKPKDQEVSQLYQTPDSAEPERYMIRMYRHLAEMDADTFGEIQTWINDMEKIRPGFTGWFRIEFQNRFPEFDEWKMKVLKKRESKDSQNGPMEIKSVNGS